MTVATRQPVQKVDDPVLTFDEYEENVRQAAQLVQKKQRNEATRQRRRAAIDKEINARNEAIDTVLHPLLDRVFAYTVDHWETLAPRQSPQTIKLDAVDFKRHIDTKGSKQVDEQDVTTFLQNIENTDLVKTLRHTLDDTATGELIARLKHLVTKRIVTVLDSDTLKEIVKEQPLINIPGFKVEYHDTVTMVVHRSAAEQRENKPPIKETRELPRS